MAAEEFNSLGGYSVGIPPVPVIDANGNVVTNVLNTTGNVAAANVYAGNYFYANGHPFTGGGDPGGSNTTIQYNDENAFNGSANFTFDKTTELVTIPNLTVTGLSDLGTIANITITGGGSGYVLSTDGSGALSWLPPGSGTSGISNGNSNLYVTASGGNIAASVGGNANVLVITSNGIVVDGNVTATNFSGNISGNATTAGTVTTNAQPNITSVGTLTSLNVSSNVTAGNIKSDHLLYANGDPYIFTTNAAGSNTQVQFNNNNAFSASANFTFNNTTNTLTVTNITANGAGLSSLTGANVTGAVGYATVANSVSVSNVVGIGNIATSNYDGNASNVLHGDGTWSADQTNYGNSNVVSLLSAFGSNNITTTGNVTAGNLSGNGALISSITGANVSGAVAYATTANSVAGANVSGAVNLANYASVANSVAGANVTGTVANATYALTSGSADTAGTVTTNAQPNITSVGTLTGLTVDGNILPNANVTYNLGSPTQRWKDLYISGNTIDINGSTISSDANGITLTNPLGGTFTVVGTGASNNKSIVNGNSSIIVDANSNVNISVSSVSNVVVVAQDGLYVTGNANITGNLFATNANLGNAVRANFFIGDGNQLGNITGANVTGTVANANYATYSGTSNTAGTVTTNAQPNITSVGTLTSLHVSGSANIGANVNMNNQWINNVGYPSLTTDVATKDYVDTMVSTGIAYHQPVSVATTTTLAIATSGTTAYVEPNGAGNGVGAYISTTGTYTNIDGEPINTVGTRILVKNEANAVWNGVYVYANSTAIVRSTDADEYGPDSTTQLSINDYFFVQTGFVNEGTAYVVSSPPGVITFGTSDITFAEFSSSQVYNAGTGLTLTGTTFSVNESQTQITEVGTLTGLTSDGVVNFANTSNVTLGAVGNVHITGGTANYILKTDGLGNLSWIPSPTGSDISYISNGNSNVSIAANGNVTTSVSGNANILTVTGTGVNVAGTLNTTGLVTIPNTAGGATAIAMGNPTQGNLVSNAVTLSNSSSVSNAIAQLNAVLGKLVPPTPPNFPASQSISIQTLSTYRMANFTQTDNTPGANKSVAGGTTVTNVRRASSYTTGNITVAGPGDQGTITAYLNGTDAGNRTLTSSLNGNGTYSNLVIYNNYDYNTANANIAAGFWSVFSSRAAGTVTEGWNEVYIADSATSNTNTANWYYDSSAPGTPAFSSLTISPPGSPSYTYSSTVPHYNNTNIFTLTANVNKLSGNMYPTSDTFVTGTAGGAFGAPGSVTYAAAGVTTPLAQNLYVSSGNASISTTSTIVSGFGASSTGPSLSSNNSYNSNTQAFTSTLAANVLYKTGTVSSASVIEEANVYVGSTIGTGSGLAFRIVNPGSANTPTYTGSEAAFNSQSSTLQTYDATVVANILKHDQTNYSTGYLPVGPDLSSGRTGSQFFTFKIIRTSVSKFDVKWTGNIAGLWVALPGSTIDTTSTANGWIDMSVAYAGAGVPGAGVGGNGSNGCALGGIAPLNSSQTNKSVTATFGTVSSSSTATNEIYIRVKLTSGQSVTALSLQTASN